MNNRLLAINLLEQHSTLLLDQTDLTYDELQTAIEQLLDAERYVDYTTGLWATDRPDLFNQQMQSDLLFELNFWGNKEL